VTKERKSEQEPWYPAAELVPLFQELGDPPRPSGPADAINQQDGDAVPANILGAHLNHAPVGDRRTLLRLGALRAMSLE
jgi:hypothetical protein